jgi:hypothetical protein
MGPLFLCDGLRHGDPVPVCFLAIPANFLEVAMRDVYQVIQEKELEIVKVRQEVDALRAILPLLMDEEDDVIVDGPVNPPLRVVNHE